MLTFITRWLSRGRVAVQCFSTGPFEGFLNPPCHSKQQQKPSSGQLFLIDKHKDPQGLQLSPTPSSMCEQWRSTGKVHGSHRKLAWLPSALDVVETPSCVQDDDACQQRAGCRILVFSSLESACMNALLSAVQTFHFQHSFSARPKHR